MRFRMAIVALLAPTVLLAQGSDSIVALTGRVLDQTDTGGIAHATLNVVGTNIEARTDGWGYYTLRGLRLGSHTLVVRAIGYARLTQSLDLLLPGKIQMDIPMMRAPHMLATMVIMGRSARVPRGFEDVYRRGLKGWGHFITREQIDSINPLDLKTMLSWIPGVHPNDHGVTFAACGNPHIWVEGQDMTRFEGAYAQREFLDYLIPSEVQAVEVYTHHVEVPPEFLSGEPCGVIAIWFKHGP